MCDSCIASFARWRSGTDGVEHRWALALLQPGVEAFLRDRSMARLAVEVIVGLGKRVRRLLEQSLAFRPCLRSRLRWSLSWRPVCWLHLVGGQVNQMAPFANASGNMFEVCVME